MRRLSTIVAMSAVVLGCGSGTFNGSPATTAPTTTLAQVDTTTTVPGTTDIASPEPPATTIVAEPDEPECELGDSLDAVWQVVADSGHGTAFHIGDGEWITAAHVIGLADEVVLLNGSNTQTATVVGTDFDTDVAVVHASAEIASVVMAGEPPSVGDPVLAAGFPLYDATSASVTRGVVSRLERDPWLGELLLTDTAVNPGNSGGPLLDECGHVVGMVVEKIVSLDVEGVGYAVSASELMSQLPRLRSGYRSAVTPIEPTIDDLPQFDDPYAWWNVTPSGVSTIAWVQAGWWDGPQTSTKPPEIWVHCDGSWSVWWPDAYIYSPPAPDDMPHMVDTIATEWTIDDSDYGLGSWTRISDQVVSASSFSHDLDAAARAGASELVIQSWNGYWEDQNPIGTAMFPLDGYADQMAVLQRECT